MKPEPLDEKIVIDTKTGLRFVPLDEVEKRIRGLLEEIEKRIKELEDWQSGKTNGVSFLGVKDGWEYLNVLNWCKQKIKKWFGDVVE